MHSDDRGPDLPFDPKLALASLGLLLAPFFGLLWDITLALGLLALALGVTAWMLLSLIPSVDAERRGIVKGMAWTLAALAVVAVVLLVVILAQRI